MPSRLLSLAIAILAVWHSDLESPSALPAFWLPLLAVFAGLFALLCGQPFNEGECGLPARRRRMSGGAEKPRDGASD